MGVPVTLAYNQWTQYNEFPQFTKKVESAEKNRNEEQKVNWEAQVFWSHRTWEATVIEQVPDERIIWRAPRVRRATSTGRCPSMCSART